MAYMQHLTTVMIWILILIIQYLFSTLITLILPYLIPILTQIFKPRASSLDLFVWPEVNVYFVAIGINRFSTDLSTQFDPVTPVLLRSHVLDPVCVWSRTVITVQSKIQEIQHDVCAGVNGFQATGTLGVGEVVAGVVEGFQVTDRYLGCQSLDRVPTQVIYWLLPALWGKAITLTPLQ